MFNKNIFSKRLRDLRTSANLTQEELAKQFDVVKQTVGHWETGFRLPPLETATAIADYFNISLDYLTGRIEEGNPEDVNFGIDFEKYRYNPCGQCGNSDFSKDAIFCKKCGCSLLLYCTHCNKLNLPTANFCEHCGKKLYTPFPDY